MTTTHNPIVQAQAEKTAKASELAVKLDTLALEAQEALRCKGSFEKAIAMGIAMANLREALNDKVMSSIMKLKGSQLGFRTDERPSDAYNKEIFYDTEAVRDCLIVAVSQGLSPVGNQWNILAGRCYTTKQGLTHLLRNLPGLKNLKLILRPAEIKESSTTGTGRDGRAYQKIEREGMVKVDISWEFNGIPDNEPLEFCIRVNNGMSQDAILGKAERKAKAWLYARLTETELAEGDVEDFAPMRTVNPRESETSESVNPIKAAGVTPAPAATPTAVEEMPTTEAPAGDYPIDGEIMGDAPDFALKSPSEDLMRLEELMKEAGITKPILITYCRHKTIYFEPASPWDKTFSDQAIKYLIDNFEDVQMWYEERSAKLNK